MVNFEQKESETLTQACSRFQSLLKQGPDLGIDDNLVAQTFYMSLEGVSQMHLDGSAGGSFLDLTAKEGMDILTRYRRLKPRITLGEI